MACVRGGSLVGGVKPEMPLYPPASPEEQPPTWGQLLAVLQQVHEVVKGDAADAAWQASDSRKKGRIDACELRKVRSSRRAGLASDFGRRQLAGTVTVSARHSFPRIPCWWRARCRCCWSSARSCHCIWPARCLCTWMRGTRRSTRYYLASTSSWHCAASRHQIACRLRPLEPLQPAARQLKVSGRCLSATCCSHCWAPDIGHTGCPACIA